MPTLCPIIPSLDEFYILIDHPWIKQCQLVYSMLHQCIKYIINVELVTIARDPYAPLSK